MNILGLAILFTLKKVKNNTKNNLKEWKCIKENLKDQYISTSWVTVGKFIVVI